MKILMSLLLVFLLEDINAKYIDYKLEEKPPRITFSEIQYEDGSSLKIPRNSEIKVINLKIKLDDSSSNKFYIPDSFVKAVIELNKMLPEKIKKTIFRKNNEKIEYTERESLFFELALFLEKIWEYKSNNDFSMQLQKYGIYKNIEYHENDSTHWVLEVLLRGVDEYNNDRNYDLDSLLPYYGYISYKIDILNSMKLPLEKIPTTCGKNKNDIKTKWIEIEGANIYLNQIELLYIQCNDNSILAYQLDRGWFHPSNSMIKKIEQK